MSRHSRWAAPQGPSAVSKAAERAARFNTGSSSSSSSSSSSQKAGSSSSGSGQTQSSSAAQSLDLLLSPSRGELAHEKSLRDPSVQAEYRQHLQSKLQAYYRRFSLEEAWHAGEANDILSNILLDYRKLREGLLASSRSDQFAIDVYQEAISLACYARHTATLTTALPSLLHLYAHKHKHSQLEQRLDRLTLDNDHTDQVALHASLHLLHQLSSTEPGARFKFCDTLHKLTSVSASASLYASRSDHLGLSAAHPHLRLATSAFKAVHRRDWVGFRRLLDGAALDDRQKLLLRAIGVQLMPRLAWESIAMAYQMVPKQWLAIQLGSALQGQEELRDFLLSQGLTHGQMAEETIQLRLPRKVA